MPRLTERERLADLEARQRKLDADVTQARRMVRARYSEILMDLPVEAVSEREFRELLSQAIRVGASAALKALKLVQTPA